MCHHCIASRPPCMPQGESTMKRVLYAAGLVLLILVLALGVFLFTFDANRFRPQIVGLVEQQTGRDFRLGEISLTLWPSLGLDLHQAVLGNAPGFGENPLARIERIHLKVALLPLLRRELKVDTILLDGLQLELARQADGRSNWEGLAAAGDATAKAPEGQRQKAPARAQGKATEGSAAREAPLKIEIRGLAIRNTRIHYRDESAGTDLVLDPFELETGALIPGQPMPLKARLHLKRQPDTELDARLEGRLTLDPERQRYRIEQLKLVLGVEAPDLPGGRLESTL
ncbi:MAG TPA: AsmA family protein, partial [Chromatiales bacterium]|nr:AsmA family protein [Chromatiales bacterium]